MINVFNEIRNTVDGVVGSYLMDIDGGMIGNDVPPLFETELLKSSADLFQLIDIVKSERPIGSIEVKAEQGYIQMAISDEYVLGTFASKHADESLLNLVVNKAITTITPENLPVSEAQAQQADSEPTEPAPAAEAGETAPVESAESVEVPAADTPTPPAPGAASAEVDDEVRVALCQAVKGKVKIMYGDKRAETIVSEAFDEVGAKRDTRNQEELKAVFDKLACGIMAKMLGAKKAKKFLNDLYEQHGLM